MGSNLCSAQGAPPLSQCLQRRFLLHFFLVQQPRKLEGHAMRLHLVLQEPLAQKVGNEPQRKLCQLLPLVLFQDIACNQALRFKSKWKGRCKWPPASVAKTTVDHKKLESMGFRASPYEATGKASFRTAAVESAGLVAFVQRRR